MSVRSLTLGIMGAARVVGRRADRRPVAENLECTWRSASRAASVVSIEGLRVALGDDGRGVVECLGDARWSVPRVKRSGRLGMESASAGARGRGRS